MCGHRCPGGRCRILCAGEYVVEANQHDTRRHHTDRHWDPRVHAKRLFRHCQALLQQVHHCGQHDCAAGGGIVEDVLKTSDTPNSAHNTTTTTYAPQLLP